MKKLIKDLDNQYHLHEDNKLIATSNGFLIKDNVKKLLHSNCVGVEKDYDKINELAEIWAFETNGDKWSNNDNTAGDNFGSFKAGALAMLEILGDKKFSADDMIKVFFLGRESLGKALVTEQEAKTIVQSLQQTEWEVEVEIEENGFLILKRK